MLNFMGIDKLLRKLLEGWQIHRHDNAHTERNGIMQCVLYLSKVTGKLLVIRYPEPHLVILH
jgi:hypothetical protein